MNEVKRPIPPPPPPPSCHVTVSTDGGNMKNLVLNHLVKNEKSAFNRSDLNRALLVKLDRESTVGTEEECFISHLQHVIPVLQDGPKCGLVALCMAAQILDKEEVSIETVFEAARSRGFTKQGEMFSADVMAMLCEQLLGCRSRVVRDEERENAIMEAVLCGCPVLVPYDKDCNNEPCWAEGTKAHWALIAGFVIRLKEQSPSSELCTHLEHDLDIKTLYHTKSNENLNSLLHDLPSASYVYAYQGKSRRPNVWSLDDLLQSNAQLTRLDPKIVSNIEDFVIPDCGIEGGLCKKIVVLQKK